MHGHEPELEGSAKTPPDQVKTLFKGNHILRINIFLEPFSRDIGWCIAGQVLNRRTDLGYQVIIIQGEDHFRDVLHQGPEFGFGLNKSFFDLPVLGNPPLELDLFR